MHQDITNKETDECTHNIGLDLLDEARGGSVGVWDSERRGARICDIRQRHAEIFSQYDLQVECSAVPK